MDVLALFPRLLIKSGCDTAATTVIISVVLVKRLCDKRILILKPLFAKLGQILDPNMEAFALHYSLGGFLLLSFLFCFSRILILQDKLTKPLHFVASLLQGLTMVPQTFGLVLTSLLSPLLYVCFALISVLVMCTDVPFAHVSMGALRAQKRMFGIGSPELEMQMIVSCSA